jgi:hypothetical protein
MIKGKQPLLDDGTLPTPCKVKKAPDIR